MIRHSPYGAYAKAATTTVSNTRQIVMLFDGAIRFLNQAREAMLASRIEERFSLLIKASNVLGGLQAALDFDNQREMAGQLYDFYGALDYRINELHQTNDIAELDAIVQELRGMRDVWDRIDREGADAVMATPGDPASGSL